MSGPAKQPARPRTAAWGAFATLAGIMAGHALLETARDALFLAKLPATHLPWMYLGIAAGAFFVARLHRVTRHHQSQLVLSAMLAAAAAVTLGFWLIGGGSGTQALYALYLWSGLYATTLVVQFWLVTSEAYTITQAKRVYAFVGAGGVIGAIGGAVAARVITTWFAPHHLLLASAATLAITSVAPLVGLSRRDIEPRSDANTPPPGRAIDMVRSIAGDAYLSRLALLVLVASITITCVDFLFKGVAAETVHVAELGSFFATVNIGLNVLALAAQLLLLPLVLRKVGVSRMLAVLPALLVVGAAGLAAGGGLLAALLLMGTQGGLRHTLHRTGSELLYVPIAGGSGARAKAFIDGTGARVGQALGSLGILALVAVPQNEHVIALAVLGLSVVWIAIALSLRSHYLHIFRANLSRGAIQSRVHLPALDLESLEAIMAALNSGEDAEVLAALDFLRAEGKQRLIPGLILYHPSTPVVLCALAIFEGAARRDVLGVAERLHLHPDPAVRAAALRLRTATRPDESFLRAGLSDDSPAVRAAALVGLLAGGWMEPTKARRALVRMAREGPTETRLAIVDAVRHERGEVGRPVLLELAKARERVVRRRVAEAMAELADPSFLPVLLGMLAERDLRDAARSALLSMDDEALAFLAEALADLSLPHEVRRHVPRTISRFRPSRVAPILLARMLDEPDGVVRFKILRGLGTLRANNPTLRLDSSVLQTITERHIEGAYRMIEWRLALERDDADAGAAMERGHELLDALLRDKVRHVIERIFRLLGLLLPQEDFGRIYRGLQSKDPRVRASARELLENTLPPRMRNAALGLIDDCPDSTRFERAAPFYQPRALGAPTALEELLDCGSESLQCLAAYHVGERGLFQLRPRLVDLSSSRSLLVRDVVQSALALLDRPFQETARHARQ